MCVCKTAWHPHIVFIILFSLDVTIMFWIYFIFISFYYVRSYCFRFAYTSFLLLRCQRQIPDAALTHTCNIFMRRNKRATCRNIYETLYVCVLCVCVCITPPGRTWLLPAHARWQALTFGFMPLTFSFYIAPLFLYILLLLHFIWVRRSCVAHYMASYGHKDEHTNAYTHTHTHGTPLVKLMRFAITLIACRMLMLL